MGWRNIYICNPAHLAIKNSQLTVKQGSCDVISIPIEDISVIVFENQQITMTNALLAKLAQNNIVVFACDQKHLPCGLLLSFSQHSRQQSCVLMQIQLSEPFKKRCWQKIVQEKIRNQALCLAYCGKEGEHELRHIAEKVQSGDTDNKEAYAARLYFKYLDCGYRSSESIFNSMLDYGYAILRGVVARSLSAYGFVTALGIHHHSELNAFNLADDFIEPIRPIVDLWSVENAEEADCLNKHHKAALISLLQMDILIDHEKHTVANAIEKMIKSFVTACREKDYDKLLLPKLLPLEIHSYE